MHAGSHIPSDRIERALFKVARLVERDPAFAPIFERLESELESARLAEGGKTDAQRRAARLLDQRAIPASRSRTWATDAPAP